MFSQALYRVAHLSSSLLFDVDNNAVESYNSAVNKFVGGKRINFSLRGSYQGRCFAAAVCYNNKGNFVVTWVIKKKMENTVLVYTQILSQKRKFYRERKINKKNSNERIQSADFDYGKCEVSDNVASIPDMFPKVYEDKKKIITV